MLIKNHADLDAFKKMYGIDGAIEKEYWTMYLIKTIKGDIDVYKRQVDELLQNMGRKDTGWCWNGVCEDFCKPERFWESTAEGGTEKMCIRDRYHNT